MKKNLDKVATRNFIDRTIKTMKREDFYFLDKRDHETLVHMLDKLWAAYKVATR